MSTELRIHTTVLPGHRIEVIAPELSEGCSVEVMVVPSATGGSLSPSEIFRLPMEERRRILAEAAEGMVEYYESTADERVEWQGGDIIE